LTGLEILADGFQQIIRQVGDLYTVTCVMRLERRKHITQDDFR
jgi:hypothetical protein